MSDEPKEEWVATCPKCGDELIGWKQDGRWLNVCIMCQREYDPSAVVWKKCGDVPADKRQVLEQA